MYDEYKVYGPYTAQDGRQRVILRKDGKNKTLSFPRYLMECSLGRALLPDEDVHHIDHDPSNNVLSNLQIVNHVRHCREHSLKYREPEIVTCFWCSAFFELSPIQQRTRYSNRNRVNAGPFCSKKCRGQYAQSTQMGTSAVNAPKFGEPFTNGNAEPSLTNEEGVETRQEPSRTDEGIVQTTNTEKWQ
jgi:hypothetical protein